MAHGQIDYINGLMNSGKTSEMIMQAHGVEEGGYAKALIIVPSIMGLTESDKLRPRASKISTSVDISVGINENISDRIADIIPTLGKRCLKAVFVDEAQFLTTEQVYELASYAHSNPAIDVKAFGLKTDYKLDLFPGSMALYAIANNRKLDKAKCYKCGSPNPIINARLIDGKYNFNPDSDQIAVNNVGGTTYETDCLDCLIPIVKNLYENEQIIADNVLRITGIK